MILQPDTGINLRPADSPSLPELTGTARHTAEPQASETEFYFPDGRKSARDFGSETGKNVLDECCSKCEEELAMKRARPISRKIKIWNLIRIICLIALSLSTFSAVAQNLFATHHVREAVSSHQALRLHELSATETLKLSVVLPLRNQTELDDLLSKLYDPQSPQYHHWLSVQEFTERFGPAEADYEALVSFLKANGMAVTGGRPANRMLVSIEGSIADINRTFHVTLGVYQHPTEDRTFFAPDREPSIDLDIPLWHVAGLDNFSLPHSLLRSAQNAETAIPLATGSGPSRQFLGSDIRAAYYGGTALTGAGQSIGLVGANYNISDVENYFSKVGQPFKSSVVENHSIDGSTNSCGSGCDDGEPVIDIISSYSMAPGVNSVIMYFGNGFISIFNAMAAENIAKQLSTSIVYLPADPTSAEPIFKEFAAQGQTFFSASGDSGAYSSSNVSWYPSDDPYVTAAGGTDLVTNGAGGPWQSESSWVGSGGGISTSNIAIPDFQQISGVINSSNKGSTVLRNVPDISMEANTDNWVCTNGNCGGGWGGTSFAAPRLAGFMALVNEQAANNGNPTIGSLNTSIYKIGVSSSYNSIFHDISSGNNDNSSAGYSAVAGYDLITGWGTPNGQDFINSLAGPIGSFTLSSSPGALTITSGSSTTSTITVTAVNGFSGPVALSLANLPTEVTAAFSPTTTSGTSTLTLTASSTAKAEPATITITGTSGSLTTSITMALTVNAAPGFTLTPSSSQLSLAQGGSTSSTITVTSSNGFSDSVALSLANLPTGVTAAFSPNPATGTSTLTLMAGASAVTGKVPVTITGTSGNLSATTSLSLTVTAPPDFSISPSPSSLTVNQGSSGTSIVTVTNANGFSNAVTLAASGLPTGVTASFSPNPATGISTLTLAASATAPLGSANVTITGTSGSLSHNATLALTVNAMPTFSLGLSTKSLTVGKSTPGIMQAMLSSTQGYQGTIKLSCTGLPNGTSCSFSPPSIALQSSNASSTLTIVYSTATASSFPRITGILQAIQFPWCLVSFFGVFNTGRRRRARSRILLWPLLGIGLSFIAITGCGMGSSNTKYQITVSAVDTNQQSQTQTFTLDITQ